MDKNDRSAELLSSPAARRLVARIGRKGPLYWMAFLLMLAIGLQVAPVLERAEPLLPMRWAMSQLFIDSMPFQLVVTGRVLKVTIGDLRWDNESGWASLSPILLARLVERLCNAGVQTIGIDLDMAASDPVRRRLHPDLARQIEALSEAIRNCENTAIVLPTSFNRSQELERTYLSGLTGDPSSSHVTEGTLNLPIDLRRLPIGWYNPATNQLIPSFALAVARTVLPDDRLDSLVEIGRFARTPPAVSFLESGAIPEISAEAILSATDLEVRRAVANKIVLIGGVWNSRTRNSGSPVDSHATPLGPQSGVHIWATYVEAMLSGRYFHEANGIVSLTLKLLSLMVLCLVIVATPSLSIRSMALGVVLTVDFLIAYIAWVNVGIALDIFVPLAIVAADGLIARLVER